MSDQKNTQDLPTRLLALADADLTDYAGLNKEKVEQLRGIAREAADALEQLIAANVMGDSCRHAYPKLEEEAGRLDAEVVALKAKLAEAKQEISDRDDGLQTCHDDIVSLVLRVEKAEAEAAALREAITPRRLDELICGWTMAMGHSFTETQLNSLVDLLAESLSQPGPGAAHQAYVRKLEAVAETAAEVAYGDGLKEHIGDKLHKALSALDKKG